MTHSPRPPNRYPQARFQANEMAERCRRADLLLLRAVRRQRASPSILGKGAFWGTVITDDEVDRLLQAHGEFDVPRSVGPELEAAIERSVANRDHAGGGLGRLRREHGLTGVDVDLFLLAFLPEISAGYGKIFAYLNDNISHSWLTVELAARIVATGRTERLRVISRLHVGRPLMRAGLLEVSAETGLPYALRRLGMTPNVVADVFDDFDSATQPELHLVSDGSAEEQPDRPVDGSRS